MQPTLCGINEFSPCPTPFDILPPFLIVYLIIIHFSYYTEYRKIIICYKDNRRTRGNETTDRRMVSIREEENYGIITVIEASITIHLHYDAYNRVIYLMTCVAVYDI